MMRRDRPDEPNTWLPRKVCCRHSHVQQKNNFRSRPAHSESSHCQYHGLLLLDVLILRSFRRTVSQLVAFHRRVPTC